MRKSDIFTISNILSFFRIFLVFPIFYFISVSKNELVFLVIIIAVITDLLDGYFARKFDQITELGKVLDPLGDKVCTTGGFIALSIYQDFPIWLTILIISRDIVLLFGSLFIIKKMASVASSNIPGKITVLVITSLGLAYLLNLQILYMPIIIAVVIMIPISTANYVYTYMKGVKANNDK